MFNLWYGLPLKTDWCVVFLSISTLTSPSVFITKFGGVKTAQKFLLKWKEKNLNPINSKIKRGAWFTQLKWKDDPDEQRKVLTI